MNQVRTLFVDRFGAQARISQLDVDFARDPAGRAGRRHRARGQRRSATPTCARRWRPSSAVRSACRSTGSARPRCRRARRAARRGREGGSAANAAEQDAAEYRAAGRAGRRDDRRATSRSTATISVRPPPRSRCRAPASPPTTRSSANSAAAATAGRSSSSSRRSPRCRRSALPNNVDSAGRQCPRCAVIAVGMGSAALEHRRRWAVPGLPARGIIAAAKPKLAEAPGARDCGAAQGAAPATVARRRRARRSRSRSRRRGWTSLDR